MSRLSFAILKKHVKKVQWGKLEPIWYRKFLRRKRFHASCVDVVVEDEKRPLHKREGTEKEYGCFPFVCEAKVFT